MNTLFVGRHFIDLKSIDSTNVYALKMIQEKKCFEGTLISALEQNNGKGQRGNHWNSNPGENITASIIFTPAFLNAKEQFDLNKTIALAIRDFISALCKEKVKIKWPNDILVDNKKVAGILIENILRGTSINYAVVGFGININQRDFPNLPQASSVKNFSGVNHNISACIESVCSYIEKRYLQLKSKHPKINTDYLENLFQFEEWCDYEVENEIIKAKIKDVSKSGKLILELKEGNRKEFDLKELKFVF
jgi:BirA family biotin operon repressor/biotin-[acetyl-CoA-carboxylase] ligase